MTENAKPPVLPSKMSDLLELAITDARKLDLEKYIPASNCFHEPVRMSHEPDSEMKCQVCLAGAVMAGTLGADVGDELTPRDYEDDTYRKLSALDSIRLGNWDSAGRELLLTSDDMEKIEKLEEREELFEPVGSYFSSFRHLKHHLTDLDECVEVLRANDL